jgi:hypothetical protein
MRSLRKSRAPLLDTAHEPQDVGMRVVERGRGYADDVGFAPIAEDAGMGKMLEQRATAGATARHAQG